MSVVYGAFDVLLERNVALKVLRLDASLDSPTLTREARVLAAVRHPNVVTVYGLHADNEVDGRAAPFFVMEHVEGTTLSVFVAEQRPDVRGILTLLERAAAGIDAIHAVGLVHGDVKPANVLVEADGTVKVADMGLVPLLERMCPGEILGTPAYISPERATGMVLEPHLGPRSDVYSFACSAMELLTGSAPFVAESTAGVLVAHAISPAPKVSQRSGLAPSFDAPFERALDKRPASRPESCSAFVALLRRAAEGTDPWGRSLRILIVDDDGDERDQLAATLGMCLPGASIASASDGTAALGALHDPPDVVLLDLSMPGLSGIEVAAQARCLAPKATIMVVTGRGSGAEWSEARALGVRRFFVKPVPVRDLVRAIEERLEPSAE